MSEKWANALCTRTDGRKCRTVCAGCEEFAHSTALMVVIVLFLLGVGALFAIAVLGVDHIWRALGWL